MRVRPPPAGVVRCVSSATVSLHVRACTACALVSCAVSVVQVEGDLGGEGALVA